MLRRQWIEAGFQIDRRLMSFGGWAHWPTDLRSAADEWIGLLQTLGRLWSHWPLDVARAIRRAWTCPEVIGGSETSPPRVPPAGAFSSMRAAMDLRVLALPREKLPTPRPRDREAARSPSRRFAPASPPSPSADRTASNPLDSALVLAPAHTGLGIPLERMRTLACSSVPDCQTSLPRPPASLATPTALVRESPAPTKLSNSMGTRRRSTSSMPIALR